MSLLTNLDDTCDYGVSVTQVFPNAATTVFNTIFKSPCSSGLITDGIITATTITKIGKENTPGIKITVIPTNGSVFLGWSPSPTVDPYNPDTIQVTSFNIINGNIWYAVFDKDCSFGVSDFCYNTDKDKLCSSCDNQIKVYFDNKNNQYFDEGITNNTYWYGTQTLETLITFSGVSTTNKVGWSFNLSSSEISGGGTFIEKVEGSYRTGLFGACVNNLKTKRLTLKCRPSNTTIPYVVFLYKNGEKFQRFERTGNSDILILSIRDNPNDSNAVYKLKYVSKGNLNLSSTISTETEFEFAGCGGGYNRHYSDVYIRSTTSGLISPDGYYSQIINGYGSQYSVIYQILNGLIIDKSFCGSDILECNSKYATTGIIDSVTITGTHSWGTYNRTWSSKNLDITRYNNGDPIPLVTGATEWANLTTGAYCYYNNDVSNGNTYGLLYNWYAVNDSRGLAPVGWSIPTRDDIIWLVNNFENSGGIDLGSGGSLKEVGFSHWDSPNLGATNESGFTALPGGVRMIETFSFGVRRSENKFTDLNRFGYWWTLTDRNLSVNGKPTSYQYYLSHSSKYLSDSNQTNWKAAGLSVRLIRN